MAHGYHWLPDNKSHLARAIDPKIIRPETGMRAVEPRCGAEAGSSVGDVDVFPGPGFWRIFGRTEVESLSELNVGGEFVRTWSSGSCSGIDHNLMRRQFTPGGWGVKGSGYPAGVTSAKA